MRRNGRSSVCSALSSWASPPVDGGRAVRSINLLRLAFDAELLRLRAMMARQGRRAAFAVIALIFGVLAARSSPGHTEQEALRVRRQALDAARGALAFTAAVPAWREALA